MSDNKIPEAAVEALAHVLAMEALFNADMAGTGWNADTDSSDHFLPNARKQARGYLEAAAPHMLAQAWDEGHIARNFYPFSAHHNPYRSAP